MPQGPPGEDAAINPYAAPRAFTTPPRRARAPRRVSILWSVLCCVQMAFICAGIAAAFAEIESILISGPLLSATGCGLALAAAIGRSRGLQRVAVVLFGLSTPGISLFCLVLILWMKWGPEPAQRPVSTITLVYGLIAAALCLGVLLSPLHNRSDEPDPAPAL